MYTVPAKNGEPRATTLRDAKKMGLLPSVTTIMKAAASPGLEQWKMNQMMLAALRIAFEESGDAGVAGQGLDQLDLCTIHAAVCRRIDKADLNPLLRQIKRRMNMRCAHHIPPERDAGLD